MNLRFLRNHPISPSQVAQLLDASGIKRPTDDLARIEKMYAEANLIISAWDGERLVGIARALSDFSYCCYLSDLAVDTAYQKHGIGKALVEQIQVANGPQVSLILLSASEAMDYYGKLGFDTINNGFIMRRQS
ncbi:GNAT family N-acetyltransferase [Ampullimonas aquatilis]|uniref:GNAT family N-acetyltransferase n=1 Tax=Ampullimonas aquatilis TaxID=1341549 RepID=UPI003C733FC3